jgi:hypothetical protein
MRSTPIVGLLVLASCALAPRRSGRELMAPVALPLSRYMKTELRTVPVVVGGRDLPFLFDTGGGVTVISPDVASAIGCTPSGRLTAHRMSGERIDAPRCAGVSLALGGVLVKTDAIVMDLATMLPPDWQRVHGLVSIRTIEDLPFTVSLPQNELILETPLTVQSRVRAMRPLQFRVARPAAGLATDVFVRVDARPEPLWMLLDSGNIDRLVLAPHAAKAEGLTVAGLPVSLPTRELNIIYDGNLGAAFLAAHTVSVDLPSERMWIE